MKSFPSSTYLVLCTLLTTLQASATTYNVVEMGARAGAQTDSTKSLLKAWASACASKRPATIYIPPGTYMVGKVHFDGTHCKSNAIMFRIDGKLVGPKDYDVVGSSGSWIKFESVTGVSIFGGTLNGKGTGLWACKASGKSCPVGATTLAFHNSNNIMVSGLASINSQLFHIVVYGCKNVKLEGIKVVASGDSPNTDGIHVQLSSRVTILNSKISTGDDCISIGPGSSNLLIETIACGPGHGISIGSLGWELQEPGVQNVTVRRVNFMGTQNGVRIKTWGRPSYGFVKRVSFKHLVMSNVQNPIVIDQNYCPHNNNCPGQISGVKISDVAYEDIHGTSATSVGVKLDCSKKYQCSKIRMENIKLTYKDQQASASYVNALGSSPGLLDPSKCSQKIKKC